MQNIKIITFLIFTLIGYQVNSQSKGIFPISNAVWVGAYNVNGTPTGYYRYELTQQDTVINNVNYRKVFDLNGYHLALRQDSANKKVFVILANEFDEKLLYDFSLKVGNVFNNHFCGNNLVITKEDSTTNFSGLKRQIHFDTWGQTTWVEGVGSTTEPFNLICSQDGKSAVLHCFSVDELTMYYSGHPVANCDYVTAFNSNVAVMPNVYFINNNDIGVESFQNIDYELKIYDVNSQQILSESFNGNHLFTHELSPGLYFYSLKGLTSINRGKFIKWK